jgi:hypothetical protein
MVFFCALPGRRIYTDSTESQKAVTLFPSSSPSLPGTEQHGGPKSQGGSAWNRVGMWPSLAFAAVTAVALGQQAQPIALVPTDGVTISGGLNVTNGQATIVNSGSVTAGNRTARLALTRGGELRLCSTTTLNLSKDSTNIDPRSTALMMSLDRGAIEASYSAGRFSDVLLTPDLRVFISGPGEVDLRIRVNAQGDTCVDNHGAGAPYVTVSSLLEGGLYRVQANQRVLFEHGSLHDVVDHEAEPCGCPPPPIVSVASTGTAGGKTAKPGQVVGGPSSTPADTDFPLAQSEGLAPTPKVPDSGAKPEQAAHTRINVPLVYNGEAPPPNVPAPIPPYNPDEAVVVPKPAAVQPVAKSAPPVQAQPVPAKPTPPPAAIPRPAPEVAAPVQTAQATAPAKAQSAHSSGVFHRIGHFFSKLFGG